MTSVETFVKDAILAYPIIFKNRLDVLHHTLAVIGNGSEWDEKTGEIYYVFPDEMSVYVPDTIEQVRERIFGNITPRDEVLYLYDETVLQVFAREQELVTVMNEVDTRMNDMTVSEEFRIYPQSDYAHIMNIPENVSDDWRAACDELRPILIAHGWNF